MFKRLSFVIAIEVALLGFGLMRFPDFIENNGALLFALGVVVILVILVYDHFPKALQWSKSNFWLDSDAAAKFFRDGIHSDPLQEVGQLFDELASEANRPHWEENGPVYAFKAWLIGGMNDGTLEVWGVPLNGSEKVKLSPIAGAEYQTGALILGPNDNVPHADEIKTFHGEQYNRLIIRKTTLRKLISEYRNDEFAQRQKRQA